MPNSLRDWRTILIIIGGILMVASLFMSWGPMIVPSQSLPNDEEFVNTYFVDREGQVGVISRPGDDPNNPVLRSNIPGGILAHATKNATVILVPIVAVITLVLVIFTASSGLIYLHAGLVAIWAAICSIWSLVRDALDNALAAINPPMTAVPLLPKPRAKGISFCKRIDMGGNGFLIRL